MTARRVAAAILALVLLAAPAFAAAQRITVLSSAAQTADGNSASFLLSTATRGVLYINITATSAITDFDLWLQGSNDDGTTWFDVPCSSRIETGTTTVATAARNAVENETATAQWAATYDSMPYKHVRVKWDMTGTSITFSAVLDVK